MGSLKTIDFRGDPLLGIEADGVVLIPLRPLVEGMGLDWSSQLKRVRRDPILAGSMVVTTTENEREAISLPLDLVPGFLFRINASRVAEALRPKVLAYQRECFAVLARAFLAPAAAEAAVVAPVRGVPMDVARKLVGEARRTHGTAVAQELWHRLGLPRVASMAHLPLIDLFASAAGRPGGHA